MNKLLLLVFVVLLTGVAAAQIPRTADPVRQNWPHPIPCRIQDGPNPNLFVMTLGNVQTPLAQGIFDPVKDAVKLNNGIIRENYYRDTLGIRYYRPIDKTIFPLPPSGWCSWYFYYQHVNDEEVRRNAQWIADNLKDYGAQYVQVDDGWQAEPRGSRDWTGIRPLFPRGMADLASYIKSLGLKPGIWLAPHGQSNEEVVKGNPGVFMLKPDGTSASSSWEGKWLVDPTTPETMNYLNDLFSTLTEWGYEYFKIDGQPTVVSEFRRAKSFMKNAKETDDVADLYRNTLAPIRAAIGPKSYLLGCWGIPLEGVGYMNGSRTGGDVVLSWDSFFTALSCTNRYYFLHNIVWYCDPDVMILRSPMTIDQARVWATLQGLTGQALLTSDRVMDWSEERVRIARSVYPAVDIRPLDLYPSRQNKNIWDLKVNHLNRNYDVVGVFNYDSTKPDQVYLGWKDLGLPDNAAVHVYDFWNKEYLGAWKAGMAVDVASTACRVLTLLPANDNIQLVSTSRHITQGWVDLLDLNTDAPNNTLNGKSKVMKNDPYELRFAFPPGKNFAVARAAAKSAAGGVGVKTTNHQGWSAVQIDSPQTTEITWEVSFEPADFYHYPVQALSRVRAERVGYDGVNLTWGAQYYLNVGYQVYLDGSLVGYAPQNSFPLRGLEPVRTYSVAVETVWQDGAVSPTRAELEVNIKSMLPAETYLSDLQPIRSGVGSGGGRRGMGMGRGFGRGRGQTPGRISLAGKIYEHGISIAANSQFEYDLMGIYDTFTALAGLDDSIPAESTGVEFIIAGDGKELWRSGLMKKSDAPKPLQVKVTGVKRLLIQVSAANDVSRDQADLADAKLTITKW
ncbi:MAG: hypothetical protein AMJ79_02815 [Phycisphaerae bacterium SM23_30]|nr:MAG: hypothetical protein AMJ79_02815 [Phycisphaerae bacterium SM23_30]